MRALVCQGADASILVLAPILLLLSQDRLLCAGLSVRRRYFPPAAACVAFLLLKVRLCRLILHVRNVAGLSVRRRYSLPATASVAFLLLKVLY